MTHELFEKLKPLYGTFIDKLWIKYITASRQQQTEILQLLELLSVLRLGNIPNQSSILLPPPARAESTGAYFLGHVYYANTPMYPFYLREDEWIQHIAVFGRSGAGKTNFIYWLIQSLVENKKPFLIFDWKRNYRDLLELKIENLYIFTVGRKISPFKFNPLIPPKGTEPRVWIKKLIEILAHAYFIGEGVMHLLQESIDSVYSNFGVYSSEHPQYPQFKDVLHNLQSQKVRGRRALWMDSALRALSSLTFGGIGDVVNTENSISIDKLLDYRVVLELDSLQNSDKTFIIEALLLWIHHYRLNQAPKNEFKHAILIEEAHHIFLKQSRFSLGGELITDIILREIRELGEGIVLIDQHPSLITLPALGNSHTSLSFNLKHQSDVTSMANAMLLEQKEYLGQLPVGHAIVKLQSRYVKPFLVRIPRYEIKLGVVRDIDIKDQFKGNSESRGLFCCEPDDKKDVRVIRMQDKKECEDSEYVLLSDIAKNPMTPTKQRYSNLMMSVYLGNKVQEELVSKGLISPVEILTRKGKIKLFDLTRTGREHLSLPIEVKSEGIMHKFWKHQIALWFKDKGFNVECEVAVNGSIVDVVAKKDVTVVVEVETGKSDYVLNLKSCLGKGFDKIVVAVTDSESGKKIKSRIKKLGLLKHNVYVILAKDFS